MKNEETDAEILACWEALEACIRAAVAEGTRAEYEQRIADAAAFVMTSPRHTRVVSDFFLREYPNGSPPEAPERIRQHMIDLIWRPSWRRRN